MTGVVTIRAPLCQLVRWLRAARVRVIGFAETVRAELERRRDDALSEIAELKAEIATVDALSGAGKAQRHQALGPQPLCLRGEQPQ